MTDYLDDLDDLDDAIACPTCHGPLVPLGAMGNVQWFRCRNCGRDVSDIGLGIAPEPTPARPSVRSNA